MSGIGVYLIRHASGVFYIGSTKNFSSRKTEHLFRLTHNQHANAKLQQAYLTDSNVVFEFYPTTTREEAYALEDEWIRNSWGNPLLANTVPYAQVSPGVMPQEIRDKIRNAHTGKLVSEETRKKISDANYGRKRHDDTKALMSSQRKGIPKGVEWKAKLGQAHPSVIVEIDGVRYQSYSAAAKALGVTDVTVRNRVESTKPKFSNWVLIGNHVPG